MKYIIVAIGLFWLGCAAVSAVAFADGLPVVDRALTLVDARRMARQYNLTAQESQTEALIAGDAAASALSQTRPSVSATTYASTGNSTNVLTSAPSVAPQNIMLTAPQGFADQNVTVMVPLSTGGRLGDVARAANLRGNAAGLDNQATQITVAAAVTGAYVHALLADALTGVAEARVKEEQEQVRETQEMVTNGRLAPVDLLREQAELADAQQGQIAAQNAADLAMVDLKVALGVDTSSNITLSDTLDTVLAAAPALPADLATALHLAGRNRPDLAGEAMDVDAAGWDSRAAKAEYAPQVYAFGMADAAAGEVGQHAAYTLGIAASLPLADGGQRRADLDSAEHKLQLAREEQLAIRAQAAQAVTRAWLSLQSANAQLDAATAGVTAAQQGYDLAVMRYDAGKSVDVERLDALTALTRASANLAQAKADIVSSRADLLAAIGEGG